MVTTVVTTMRLHACNARILNGRKSKKKFWNKEKEHEEAILDTIIKFYQKTLIEVLQVRQALATKPDPGAQSKRQIPRVTSGGLGKIETLYQFFSNPKQGFTIAISKEEFVTDVLRFLDRLTLDKNYPPIIRLKNPPGMSKGRAKSPKQTNVPQSQLSLFKHPD